MNTPKSGMQLCNKPFIDAYYKPFKGWVNISPTRFILSKTPLRFAFYLILIDGAYSYDFKLTAGDNELFL